MGKRKLNAMAVDPGAAPPPAKLEYNPETGNFNRSRANRPRSQVHTQRCVCGKDECKRNVKIWGSARLLQSHTVIDMFELEKVIIDAANLMFLA